MLSQCRARHLVFYSDLMAAKVARVLSPDNRGNDHPLPEVSEQANGGELGDSYQPTPCWRRRPPRPTVVSAARLATQEAGCHVYPLPVAAQRAPRVSACPRHTGCFAPRKG